MTVTARLGRGIIKINVALFRATSGRIGGSWGQAEICLLTTVGRISREAHTTPVVCIPDGGRLLLVASNNGSVRHPNWYLNARVNPHVKLERRGFECHATARTASAEERQELWPKVIDKYKGFNRYQKKTTREIPIVIVEPATSQ